MAWIKVENHTPDKPEIGRMADMLKLDPDVVFAKCFKLWAWADELTKTGFIKGATRSEIDRKVNVLGFATSMEEVEWLSVTPTGLTIPKFARHNGQSAKARALTAKRVAKHRKEKCNGESVTRGALPEERRGEEIKGDKSPLKPLHWSKLEGWKNAIGYFPTWKSAYPNLDIEIELAKAHAWLIANPTKANRKAWGRFFNGWLGRNKANVAPRGELVECGPVDAGDPRLEGGNW